MSALDERCDGALTKDGGVATKPRSSILRRTWFTILAVAASLVGFVFLLPAGNAYSFEAMMKALESQPLIRAVFRGDSAEAVGWARTGDSRLVAVESKNSVYWSDPQQQRTLEYLRDRGQLNQTPQDSPDQLLALLSALRSLPQNGGLQVQSESWKQVGDFVELSVILKANDHVLDLIFGVDPESQLPQWVTISSDPPLPPIELKYPKSGPATLTSLGVKQDVVNAFAAKLERAAEQVTVPRSEEPVILPTDTANVIAKNSVTRQVPDVASDVATRVAARRWQSTTALEVPDSPSEMIHRLDEKLESLWASQSVTPVAQADQYELIRRLYLDLAGRVPLVHEIQTAKELTTEQLVERLLASRDFSTHMATVWSRLLLPDSVDLSQFGGVEAFNVWLAKQFRNNVAYDELVKQLLQAEGRVGESGPVLFYTALELKPDLLAKQTSRVFLGSRIDCAQCHDHPTDDWTQEDFWAYAAFFARISRPEGRMDRLSPVLRVRDVARGDVTLPDTDKIVAPRFLGGPPLVEQPGDALRRQALADWLTSSRQFSRATVNHVWSNFFGVGFVDPSDDFGTHNSAVAPEVLDDLAEFLIQRDFDLRELVRVITLSRAYRLSGRSSDKSPDRLRNFAQMNTKWLTAEQLYDALIVAARSTQPATVTMESTQRFGVDSRDAFVEKFKAPRGSQVDYQSGIPQSLAMMNGSLTMQATEWESSGMMKALSAPFFTDEQRINKIFLACVGRPPDDADREMILPMMGSASSNEKRQQILSDLFWALLNTAEFATNH